MYSYMSVLKHIILYIYIHIYIYIVYLEEAAASHSKICSKSPGIGVSSLDANHLYEPPLVNVPCLRREVASIDNFSHMPVRPSI